MEIPNVDNLPTTIKTLYIYDLKLVDTIRKLPNGLLYFWSNSSYLKVIKTLPMSLERFILVSTNIEQLPTILPDSLQYIDLSNNHSNPSKRNKFKTLPTKLVYFNFEQTNLIDTLPTLPSTLEYLNCRYSFQSFLPQLPNSLKYLDCSYNQLDTIQQNLPTSLEYLDYSFNYRISGSFPIIPSGLMDLSITNNKFTSLPSLPPSLKNLNCGYNNLTNLPNLPLGLNTLYSNGNKIDSLPQLPNTLLELSCGGCNLSNLPILPDSLTTLLCGVNLLTGLPVLPASLKILFCDYNSITTLPTLPNKLERLICSDNKLVQLPTLPDSLLQLDCSDNFLTSLPTIPIALEQLYCNNNKYLTCIPHIPDSYRGRNFTFYKTPISCLTNHPPSGLIQFGLDSLGNYINPPLCNPTNNPYKCQSFPVIQGTAFYNNNKNGIKDSGEYNCRAGVAFTLSNNNYTFTNKKGIFEIGADSLGVYTLSVTNPNFYTAIPDTLHYNFSSYDTLVTSSVALQPIAVKDSMAVYISPITRARPGFSFPCQISYENVGTTTITNPMLNFTYNDSLLVYDSTSNANVVNTGNQLSLNIGSVAAGFEGSFFAYFRLKPTVAISDSIVTIATLTNAAKTKNVTIVGGSFDPNDKQATPV